MSRIIQCCVETTRSAESFGPKFHTLKLQDAIKYAHDMWKNEVTKDSGIWYTVCEYEESKGLVEYIRELYKINPVNYENSSII